MLLLTRYSSWQQVFQNATAGTDKNPVTVYEGGKRTMKTTRLGHGFFKGQQTGERERERRVLCPKNGVSDSRETCKMGENFYSSLLISGRGGGR